MPKKNRYHRAKVHFSDETGEARNKSGDESGNGYDSSEAEEDPYWNSKVPAGTLSNTQIALGILSISVAVYLLIGNTDPIPPDSKAEYTTVPGRTHRTGFGAPAIQEAFGSIYNSCITLIDSVRKPKKIDRDREFPRTHSTGNSSGWSKPQNNDWKRFYSERCTIVRKAAHKMKSVKFEREYHHLKPVILHFANGTESWTDSALWARESMLKNLGRSESRSRQPNHPLVKYIETAMDQDRQVNESRIFIDSEFLQGEQPGNQKDSILHPPGFLNFSSGYEVPTFMIGPSGSGAPFYSTNDAWYGVIQGAQRWFLYPPSQAPPSGVTLPLELNEWMNRFYPSLDKNLLPMECILYAGEILYVPESYYRAVLSIGDSLSVSFRRNLGTGQVTNLLNSIELVEQDKNGNSHRKLEVLFPLLQELQEIHPENVDFMNRLSENYAARGDYASAINISLEAVEKDPLFFGGYLNLGKMYFASGQPQLADDYFQKAANISSTHSDLCWIYGKFLVLQKRYDEALQWFRKGEKFHPEQAEVFAEIALQAQKLHQREKM